MTFARDRKADGIDEAVGLMTRPKRLYRDILTVLYIGEAVRYNSQLGVVPLPRDGGTS